jgi:adiponectin receptor
MRPTQRNHQYLDSSTRIRRNNYIAIIYELLNDIPRYPIIFFLSTASCVFLSSFVFHIYSTVSFKVARTLQTIDFASINILFLGSSIPLILYGFQDITYQYMYLIIDSILMVIRYYALYKNRNYFLPTSLLTTFITFFMILHISYIHGIWVLIRMLVFGASYIIGSALYTFNIPEAYFTNTKFDIVGSSHQFWHICIILSNIIHYNTLTYLLYSKTQLYT